MPPRPVLINRAAWVCSVVVTVLINGLYSSILLLIIRITSVDSDCTCAFVVW